MLITSIVKELFTYRKTKNIEPLKKKLNKEMTKLQLIKILELLCVFLSQTLKYVN